MTKHGPTMELSNKDQEASTGEQLEAKQVLGTSRKYIRGEEGGNQSETMVSQSEDIANGLSQQDPQKDF